MGVEMHPAWIEPDKEGFISLLRTINEILRGRQKLLVDGFHTLAGQGAGVFDLSVGSGLNNAPGAVSFS